ncbi:class I SAM-dependent methyltransferase [Blastopirellula marina]|uniref:Class I SAM-dependent methyltransferase n=2 Tax=Blastopirellula marina TaxID=124 RepID=A0A2S8FPC3_9BACT|nr:class I SAM-dependent methyltransferase [Blastopirellula marina]PTL43821.1 class I SAM-dependent methyltransferase [Blastopirellula marina]
MQPDQLKAIFRQGWMNSHVVDHRVQRFIKGEFGFEPSRNAWKKVLAEAASGENIHRAVDMGTGPGTIAQFWAEMGMETTGVDFSATMLDAAKTVAAQQKLDISFMEADVEAPPLPTGSFDLVSSRAVLFTLPHPGYALARWAQLLRPGGLMVLIGEISPTDPEKQKRAYRPAEGWQPDAEYREAMKQLPFREHTDQMLRVVMEAVGLKDIRSISMDAVMSSRWEHEKQEPAYGVLQGTPYILVGQRADEKL